MELKRNIHLPSDNSRKYSTSLRSPARLIKDHELSQCRFSHCVCFDVGEVLRMYVRGHRGNKLTKTTPQSIRDLFEFTVVHKHFPLIL